MKIASPYVQELLNAESTLSRIAGNMAIKFQIDGPQMPSEEAAKHFLIRQQLTAVQSLLIAEAEAHMND